MGELDRWKARGRYLEVDGHQVFVVESGDAAARPLLILHGFPTSSHDYTGVLDRLSQNYRVVVHDHLGFGLSDKPIDYSYSFFEQADVALGVWKRLGIESGHLLAHDYGTTILTELIARRERGLCPVRFDSLTLCNGSIHIELARLTVAQKILRGPFGPLLAKAASGNFFKRRLRATYAKQDRVTDEHLEAEWEAMCYQDGRLRLPAISKYLYERQKFWHRWVGALTRLDLPAHVLWGRQDPIAIEAIATRLHSEIPGAELTWLDTLGHYPMLEDPALWAGAVLGFLDKQ